MICHFLLSLYEKGYSSNSLNVACSSSSFFLSYYLDIAMDSRVIRLFKYFYRSRPTRPKYVTFWPIAQLLNFLAEWHPIHDLTLKQLTLKILALIALSCSDRGRTLQLLNIENTHVTANDITFVIFDRLKTTKRNSRPHEVKRIFSEIQSLNV